MDFLRPINDANPKLTLHNRRAISYLLQRERNIELSEVFAEGQKKCETDEEAFRFVVMIMKLSCCEDQLVNTVVKDIEFSQGLASETKTSLIKADGFELLNQCLDGDGDEILISEFKMRAILISLDSLLCKRNHDNIFLNYICMKFRVQFDMNFTLYKYLEDTGEIAPDKLEIISGILTADRVLHKELKHFENLLGKLKPKIMLQAEIFATISPSHQKEIYSHPVSSEEADPPPKYTSTDKLCIAGTTPSISLVSGETSTSSTDIRLRASSESSSSFHRRPPHLSNTQRQMTYPPMESPTLPCPTQAQTNSIEPNNSRGTQTELSNAGSSIPGDKL